MPPATLPTVTVPATGTVLTRYALGGFHQLEISSERVAAVVDAYLAEGGRYIETARAYGGGASEAKLGRALEGRRDAVVLATKTTATTADEARRDLDASLAALRTDRVAFCFFHGVGPDKLRAITAKGGALEGLLAAIDEGLVGGLGMSSHHPEVYLKGLARLPLALILVWLNYLDNLNFPIIPERVVPEARRRHVAVTAMKPLADGYLHRSVEPAVRYCLGAGADVAVCGTNTPEQVREVAAAVRKGPADAAEREAILRDAVDLGRYVCRRCGRCPVEVMELFRLEGMADRQMHDFFGHDAAEAALRKVLAGWFGKADAARATWAEAGVDAAALEAAAKAVTCPYGIDVARKVRLAAAKLAEGGRPALV